jgi:FimV-like protein
MLFVLARLYVAWNKKDSARIALKTLVSDHAESSVTPRARELLKSLERERK